MRSGAIFELTPARPITFVTRLMSKRSPPLMGTYLDDVTPDRAIAILSKIFAHMAGGIFTGFVFDIPATWDLHAAPDMIVMMFVHPDFTANLDGVISWISQTITKVEFLLDTVRQSICGTSY